MYSCRQTLTRKSKYFSTMLTIGAVMCQHIDIHIVLFQGMLLTKNL